AKKKTGRTRPRPGPNAATREPAPGSTRGRKLWPVVIVLGLIAAVALVVRERQPRPSPAAAPAATPLGAARANFVGGRRCAECHRAEYDRWVGSHHDRAMQVADERTVLGDFNGATFTHAGVTSSFYRREGKFFVYTDGPDGEMREFEIVDTFGVSPLQQY